MPGENIYDWSITAANNDTADSLINWREGMARAAVNDSARSMMAAIAKFRDLLNGFKVTSGTPNAQTFSSGLDFPSIASIPAGLRVLLKIGAGLTNTGATTLGMDFVGNIPVKTSSGSDLAGGDLTAGGYAEFIYNGTNWVLREGFPTGTLMLFQQTAAPTGWTKQATHNDKALRVVSGAAGSGGVQAFGTVFGRTTVDGHTVTTAEMPGHSHLTRCWQGPGHFNGAGYLAAQAETAGAYSGYIMAFSPSFWNAYPIENEGGGQAHVHTVDLRVQYVDCIIASKD